MKPVDTKLAVGGQAVLEGVMMRSPRALAIAVRRPDGTIVLKDEPYISLAETYPLLKRPFVRGPLTLIEAMVTGVKALTFSAQAALQEEEEEEQPLGWGSITLTLGGAFLLAFLFFGFLPHWLSGLAGRLSGHPITPADLSFHVVDGIIKTPLSCCISGVSPCFPIFAGSSNITGRNTSPSAPSRPGRPWKWPTPGSTPRPTPAAAPPSSWWSCSDPAETTPLTR